MSDELIGRLLDATRAAVVVLDAAGTVRASTSTARELFGGPLDAPLAQLVSAQSRVGVQEALRDAASASSPRPVALTLGDRAVRGWLSRVSAPGEDVLLALRLELAGSPTSQFVALTRQHTTLAAENRRRKLRLQASERRFATIFAQAPIGVCLLDEQLRIRQSNAALTRLLGRGEEELRGRPFDHIAQTGGVLGDALTPATAGAEVEQRWPAADGAARWVRCVAARLPAEKGLAADVVVHVQDITAQRERERELADRARHDPLTGALNRTAFDDALSQAAVSGPTWLVLGDLDRFKLVNDTLGHLAGDRVLMELVRALRRGSPPGSAICRLGGDEFAILAELEPDATPDQLAGALLKAVRDAPLLREEDLRPTLSLGLARLTSASEADSAMLHADRALYQAKDAGRDTYVVVGDAAVQSPLV